MGPGSWEGAQDPATRLEGWQAQEATALAKALVDADLQGTSPGDLAALGERCVRMAAGLREHLAAARLLDAWAAADWLADLAQEVKAALPVSGSDIIAAVEEGGAPQLRGLLRQQAAQPSTDEAGCGCPRCQRKREGGLGESSTPEPGH